MGKKWAEEDTVKEGAEKFNAEVEEACKLQVEVIERMEREDKKLRESFGLGEERKGKDVQGNAESQVRMPSRAISP